MRAVIWTDVFQGFAMLAGMLTVVIKVSLTSPVSNKSLLCGCPSWSHYESWLSVCLKVFLCVSCRLLALKEKVVENEIGINGTQGFVHECHVSIFYSSKSGGDGYD